MSKDDAITKEYLAEQLAEQFENFAVVMNKSVDDKLDKFAVVMNKSVDEKFDKFAQIVKSGFHSVDKRFDAVDARFDAVDKRFYKIESHFDARFDARFDASFDAVDNEFTHIRREIVRVLDDIDKIQVRLDRLIDSQNEDLTVIVKDVEELRIFTLNLEKKIELLSVK